jgi:serine/threonine protein kinase
MGDRVPELAKTEVAPPEPLPERLAEGTEIAGRYRILSFIGEGGMGAVYRAQHLNLRKVFALKVLQPRNVDRRDIAARFEREAIAAARIEHPNVVPAIDFGRLSNDSFFLVLEFVNGRSLKSELKAGAMKVPRALAIMRGVVAGVRAAHERGIIHRDLKPENIMLVEKDGQRDFVKLLDFGVARLDADNARDGAPQLTEVGTMLGTPQYMSPEQILGRAVDARSDLYSLGVIFFEVLTGKCPFAGNLPELLQQHVTAPPPELPPGLTAQEPRIAEILRVLLAKEPEKRFQSAGKLVAALDEASRPQVAGAPARAPSPSNAQGDLIRGAGRTLLDLGHRMRPSWNRLASSTSAVASRSASSIRRYAGRFARRRSNLGKKLAPSAKVFWSKSSQFCRAHWPLTKRSTFVAIGCAAALVLLVVLWVTGGQRRNDDVGPKHRDRSSKTGGSPSRRSNASP